jgi:hypothetical protein
MYLWHSLFCGDRRMRFGLPLLLTMLAPGATHARGDDSTELRRIDEHVTRTMRSAHFPGVAVGAAPVDAYGFGWEFAHVARRTLINHDGGTANFQSSFCRHSMARRPA